MSDPLSIAASVAGLVAIAGTLYAALDKFITGLKDAPSLARTVQAELLSWQHTLLAVQRLLNGRTFSAARAALIPAEHVVICFTDAILLFSELDRILTPLAERDTSSWICRAKWARGEARLTALISRLQWHKGTLSLQLTILQWYVWSTL